MWKGTTEDGRWGKDEGSSHELMNTTRRLIRYLESFVMLLSFMPHRSVCVYIYIYTYIFLQLPIYKCFYFLLPALKSRLK